MQEFPVWTSAGRWPPETELRLGRVRGRSRNTTVAVRLVQSKENWHVKWRKSLSYSNRSQFPARNVFLTQEGGTLAAGLSSQTVWILLHCHKWMSHCQSEVPSYFAEKLHLLKSPNALPLTEGWVTGSQSNLKQEMFINTKQLISWWIELKISKNKLILC